MRVRRHTMFPPSSRVQGGGDAMAPCPVCLKKLRRSPLHANAIPALNLARAAACVLTAAGSLVVAVASATAADTAIYKCFDNHLGLVYTDLPCKDGEKLDIRAGDADPAAVARLERVRDQFDQSAARRIVDDRRAASRPVRRISYRGPNLRRHAGRCTSVEVAKRSLRQASSPCPNPRPTTI